MAHSLLSPSNTGKDLISCSTTRYRGLGAITTDCMTVPVSLREALSAGSRDMLTPIPSCRDTNAIRSQPRWSIIQRLNRLQIRQQRLCQGDCSERAEPGLHECKCHDRVSRWFNHLDNKHPSVKSILRLCSYTVSYRHITKILRCRVDQILICKQCQKTWVAMVTREVVHS